MHFIERFGYPSTMPKENPPQNLPDGIPVPRNKGGRPRTITDAQWDRFFQSVVERAGNVTAACFECHINRMYIFDREDKDPVFAERLKQAKAKGVAVLEDEVMRRSHDGVEKGVWFNGERVGVERTYSDALAQFMLRANAPDKYTERTRLEVQRSDTRTLADATEEELEELINKKKRG